MSDVRPTGASFDWAAAWSDAGGGPDAELGINIAQVTLGRHVRDGNGDRAALRWIGPDPADLHDPVDLTYAVLDARTNRFAAAMSAHGFGPGTGVATLLGRVPDLYISALGALKSQAVFTPLFPAFGPEPIVQRLALARVRVLVTSPTLFRRRIAGILGRLPDLELVLVCGATEDQTARPTRRQGPTVMSLGAFLSEGADSFTMSPTPPDTPALVQFTSGTTGTPKGAVHVHEAVMALHVTGRLVLDLHPGDVFWCTADPSWVTGTSYGFISPLANGATAVVDEADVDADRWYGIVERHGVNILYTSPAAIRLLRRSGPELATRHDLSSLRVVASVGEPVDAETVRWCEHTFGVPLLDTWWQTETGAIMIANTCTQEIRAGSMGRAVPGITAGVLAHDDGVLVTGTNGSPTETHDGEDQFGELAVRASWPSMFRSYLGEEERYAATFVDGWYLTGDLVRRDADGYFWFVGRDDEVITTSGHPVGPAEVEAVFDEHPGVADVAVVGVADHIAGVAVTAFVVVSTEYAGDDELRHDLLAFGRSRLATAIAPRELVFVDALPSTNSGKIMRGRLRAMAEGLEVDDDG